MQKRRIDEFAPMELDRKYWNDRYKEGQTGWDIGYAAPALTDYAAQLPNQDISILIPGCGRAYEAEVLLEQGFTNIHLLDVSDELTEALRQKSN